METIETVTAFLARVDRVSALERCSRGYACYQAMVYYCHGAKDAQWEFVNSHPHIDVVGRDENIPAFLAAAVKAGVLREG